MDGFVPQPTGDIMPANSLLWQTVRSNGNSASWFTIGHDDIKGRTVLAARSFAAGVVLMEYFGQHVMNAAEYAAFLEKPRYARWETEYLFEIPTAGGPVAIQAMIEDGTFGRLVNHAEPDDSNCRMRRLTPSSYPRLMLVSTRFINVGEEILYRYGDDLADELLLA